MCSAAVIPISIAIHVRNMVIEQETGKPVRLEKHKGLSRIEVAFADEAFLKIRNSALNVAKVDVENLALGPEKLDHVTDVLGASRHFRTTAEAEVETPCWAGWVEFPCALETG